MRRTEEPLRHWQSRICIPTRRLSLLPVQQRKYWTGERLRRTPLVLGKIMTNKPESLVFSSYE